MMSSLVGKSSIFSAIYYVSIKKLDSNLGSHLRFFEATRTCFTYSCRAWLRAQN